MMTAKLKPTAKQLAYQEWEYGLFIHFGLRTFYEGYVDFDERKMDPAKFNPTDLDCDQWIKTAKEAGMEYAVLTAKHHDGFSNWPSKYTSFSVTESEWKDGKGDVVREFVDACRKYDVKPGLYYSPYDGAADFYSNKDGKEYDDYFINQITELLGDYGDIDILWFDGAGSAGHEYDWKRIVDKIRSLQPEILIFNMADPDFRWVGNEDGIAPIPCWNVVDHVEVSIYDEEKDALNKDQWLPAECDVQIRSNWFYSENDLHTLKSLEELLGIYYHSVGRGANLLLNIGPDRKGHLPKEDTERVLELGAELERRFKDPIATKESFKQEDNKFIYIADKPHMIDHIVLQEDLTNGENVRQFAVNILTKKTHHRLPIHQGFNIGNKAIIPIPPVQVKGVEIEILKDDGEAVIKNIEVHHVGE